ncbi:uncharacterized protein [Musca autumnalis]|uniref:uncharacterized protein n=1 Tax=Musca autumnalis TaxID=221902 RepID=UPI003CF31010
MYVKIKLEPQNLNSSKKKINYFPIDDDSTVAALKRKIEQHVNVPADKQEIRSLTESYDSRDSTIIKDICDLKSSSTLLLYSYNNVGIYEEPHFVCFLQICNDEMALQQQEMEEKSTKSIQKMTNARELRYNADTLILDSESETDTESSESETSDSESESSSASECKKRQKLYKPINQPKRPKSSTADNSLSPTLCNYLEEFPNCENSNNKTVTRKESSDKHSSSNAREDSPKYETPNVFSTKDKSPYKETPKTSKVANNDVNTSKGLTGNVLSSIQSSVSSITNDNNDPCRNLNPEYRQYMVVVSKSTGNINEAECQVLLEWFFEKFRVCDTLDKLQFGNDPITLYKGKLWIACWNEITFNWIMLNIREYPEKFDVETLTKEIACEVVIPMASNNKNLLDVFDLLEKQNANLITTKWCVFKRSLLQSDIENAAVCRNELFSIRIDPESKDILQKFNLKLKYFFWQIMFKFINA